MTKPAVPTPARGQVVEIDAMDVAEWESGQRTPQASDANLAELVRKSAATPPAATPVQAAHAQTVPRERARTQMGTPAIPRPPNRARTEPPGPPPKPAIDGKKLPRAQTASGASASSARAVRVPDIPAAAAAAPPEPARLPTPTAGIDFSVPVTATIAATPAALASKGRARTPVGGVDFSLPVTATGEDAGKVPPGRRASTGSDFSLPVTATSPVAPAEASARPVPPASTEFSMPAVETSPRPPIDPPRVRSQARPGSEPPRNQARPGSEPPRSQARPGSEPPRTATATSESGARPPQLDPPSGVVPLPAPLSTFGEPSRVGPGHNATPAGGIEPNTAWPPRPIPVDPRGAGNAPAVSGQPPTANISPPSVDASWQPPPPARLVAPAPSIQPAPPPVRDDAPGAERLQVGLSRRRLWWIGGGLAAASVGAIVAALTIPSPEAPPPVASDATATQAVEQAPGPRRNPRAEPPVDRAAADLRERVRLAREAAAAGVPMTTPVEPDAAERRPAPAAAEGARRPSTHRVIVDYSARPNEPPPPSLVAQSEEDPAVGKARTAYTTGNQRLFVGDLQGAIRAYHEALELYPGYVGGFRGLGLAYEELGDTANALVALRAYVAAAPNARDSALIKKRIAHLQHH